MQSAYLIRMGVTGVDHVHAGSVQNGLHLLLEALHLRKAYVCWAGTCTCTCAGIQLEVHAEATPTSLKWEGHVLYHAAQHSRVSSAGCARPCHTAAQAAPLTWVEHGDDPGRDGAVNGFQVGDDPVDLSAGDEHVGGGVWRRLRLELVRADHDDVHACRQRVLTSGTVFMRVGDPPGQLPHQPGSRSSRAA